MPLFAIYDVDSDRVDCRETKPDSCTSCIPLQALQYVQVWYPDGFRQKAEFARTSFALRCKENSQIFLTDVELSCRKLIEIGGATAGYMAVGASGKALKWWLASHNIAVTGLNVSGVPDADKVAKGKGTWMTNAAFDSYLLRKYQQIKHRWPIVVFDFVDTGASLAMVKSKLGKIAGNRPIKTVAIGKEITVPAFPPDHVLGTIADTLLVKEMRSQNLKERTGRGKVKNPMKTWNVDTNTTPVSDKALQAYRDKKTALKYHFAEKTTEITPEQCVALINTALGN